MYQDLPLLSDFQQLRLIGLILQLNLLLSMLRICLLPLLHTNTTTTILVIIEYLHQNSIPHKVITSYISSIRSVSCLYNLPSHTFSHPAVTKLLRIISITSHFAPTPRGIFDIPTLYNISISCDSTDDPPLYRTIFVLAFYGFLRMSDIAPHS